MPSIFLSDYVFKTVDMKTNGVISLDRQNLPRIVSRSVLTNWNFAVHIIMIYIVDHYLVLLFCDQEVAGSKPAVFEQDTYSLLLTCSTGSTKKHPPTCQKKG